MGSKPSNSSSMVEIEDFKGFMWQKGTLKL